MLHQKGQQFLNFWLTVCHVRDLCAVRTGFFHHNAILLKQKVSRGNLTGQEKIPKGVEQSFLIQTGPRVNVSFLHIVFDSFDNLVETQYIVFYSG